MWSNAIIDALCDLDTLSARRCLAKVDNLEVCERLLSESVIIANIDRACIQLLSSVPITLTLGL